MLENLANATLINIVHGSTDGPAHDHSNNCAADNGSCIISAMSNGGTNCSACHAAQYLPDCLAVTCAAFDPVRWDIGCILAVAPAILLSAFTLIFVVMPALTPIITLIVSLVLPVPVTVCRRPRGWIRISVASVHDGQQEHYE